jgi:hypothetical protein
MSLVKKLAIAGVAACALAAVPSTGQAHSYDVDDEGHPFRYIAYPLHAIGKGLEYGFTRPVHYGVSQCKARYIFGHVSHPKSDDYWGDWNMYQRYSY